MTSHAGDADNRSEKKILLLCLLLIAVTVGGGGWFLGVGLSPKGASGRDQSHGSARPTGQDTITTDGLSQGTAGSPGKRSGGAEEGRSHETPHDLVSKNRGHGRRSPEAHGRGQSGPGARGTGGGRALGEDGSPDFPPMRQIRREFLARGGFSYREVELRRQLLAAQSLADAGVAAAAPKVMALQQELAILHGTPVLEEESLRMQHGGK